MALERVEFPPLYRGGTYDLTITVRDRSTQLPVDFTGYLNVFCEIRERYTDVEPLIDMTPFYVSPRTSGQITITKTLAEINAAIPIGMYQVCLIDVVVENGAGKLFPIAAGTILVSTLATQP